MPTRVDWQQIKDAWSDEQVILCLNSRSRHLLLSILPVLNWRATYNHDAASAADWDYIQGIVAEAELELGVAVPVSSIIQYIDELEDLLRSIDSKVCCGSPLFSQMPPGILPNTGTPIQDGIGSPPTTYGDQPISTWGDWSAYKCEAAYYMVEEVATRFEDLGALNDAVDAADITEDTIGWIISKLDALFSHVPLAWDLFNYLKNLVWDNLFNFQAAADSIRAAADDIACAIYQGDGAEDAAADFETAVKAELSGFGLLVADGFPYRSWANIVYTGVATDIEGNQVNLTDVLTAPGTHTCCPPVLPPPPSKAFGYPAEIVGVRLVPTSHFSEVSSVFDANTFTLTLQHENSVSSLLKIEIDVAASPYWGYSPTVSHRGLIYYGIQHDDPLNNAAQAKGTGTLHDISENCFHQAFRAIGIHVSTPYANYLDDLKAQQGIGATWESTTKGLSQNPDVVRTIRFEVITNAESPGASLIITGHPTNPTLRWALYDSSL